MQGEFTLGAIWKIQMSENCLEPGALKQQQHEVSSILPY